MLNQAAGDRQILAKQLGISPYQLNYVTHSNAGEGLMFYGDVIIPFIDKLNRGGIILNAKIRKVIEEIERTPAKKPNQVEQFKMPKDRISKFFPAGTPAKKMEDIIVKALELYRQKERNRDAR